MQINSLFYVSFLFFKTPSDGRKHNRNVLVIVDR